VKSIILFEMLSLYAGDLIIEYNALQKGDPSDMQSFLLAVTKRGLRHLVAVVILMALLLTLANAGFANLAASLGGVIVLAWWVAAAGTLGPQIVTLEKGLFE